MRVLFFTEAGYGIGFGHLTRCLSLYQAFKEQGISPELIVNGDESITGIVETFNVQTFDWIRKQPESLNILKDADIVVIDSYLVESEFYERVSSSVKMPLYIDDYRRINYPKGIVLNSSIYAEEMDYPIKEGVVYLLGTKYMPLRKEFWEVPEKKISENIKKVMITFGGDDSQNMTVKTLSLLCDEYPDLIKNVIIGKGFKNINKIEKVKEKNTNLVYFPGAKVMKQLMLDTDFAVSACGQTLYEFARVGVPVIAIAVADNQLNNAKGWQRAGFIEYAGWWKEAGVLLKVLEGVKTLFPYKVRLERKKIGRSIVDAKGAERIAEALLQRVKV